MLFLRNWFIEEQGYLADFAGVLEGGFGENLMVKQKDFCKFNVV